jgi:hypothetical protein
MAWKRWLLILSLAWLFAGCQDGSATFAGFTFGGGGNTFSCEPAIWTEDGRGFRLSSGPSHGGTSLALTGEGSTKLGEPMPLASATVTVPGQDATTLVSGTLVCQTLDGGVAHGSFDLKVKAEDGREYPVVGSFTASRAQP